MASSKKPTGTPVVIVESPAKARTIGKFLGSDYRIEASIGHIRDLPGDASEVPAELKKEKWAKLGIDVENDFRALYVVPADKKDHLKKLKAMVKDASILYLATDEDREGESISWHLVQELEPKCETRRLVFHEITKPAILEALQNPRQIDMDLVEAQETRRLVDRLYGYTVSPLLWKKVKPKLSAGRVQSVAVRLIVERERERMRFKPAELLEPRRGARRQGRRHVPGDHAGSRRRPRRHRPRLRPGDRPAEGGQQERAGARRSARHQPVDRARPRDGDGDRRRAEALQRAAVRRRSPPRRCSRRPRASCATPRSARCAPPSASTRTASSPTCARTRRRSARRRSPPRAR
jgi:hypothetical protein